jgi:hypothetical protein
MLCAGGKGQRAADRVVAKRTKGSASAKAAAKAPPRTKPSKNSAEAASSAVPNRAVSKKAEKAARGQAEAGERDRLRRVAAAEALAELMKSVPAGETPSQERVRKEKAAFHNSRPHQSRAGALGGD